MNRNRSSEYLQASLALRDLEELRKLVIGTTQTNPALQVILLERLERPMQYLTDRKTEVSPMNLRIVK